MNEHVEHQIIEGSDGKPLFVVTPYMEKPDDNLRRSRLEKIASALDINVEPLTE